MAEFFSFEFAGYASVPGLRCGKVGKSVQLRWVFDGSVKPSLIQLLKGSVSNGTVIAVSVGRRRVTPAPGWEDKLSGVIERTPTEAWSARIILFDFQPEDAGIYSIKPRDVYAPNDNAEIRQYSGKNAYTFALMSEIIVSTGISRLTIMTSTMHEFLIPVS